jgi:hypothetical protein
MTNIIRLLFLFFTFCAIRFGDIFGLILTITCFLIMEKFCEDLEKQNEET